jgi:hypothetical protein
LHVTSTSQRQSSSLSVIAFSAEPSSGRVEHPDRRRRRRSLIIDSFGMGIY